MIPSGLFTQIALVVISIGIIVFYITPTFDGISTSQEQIGTYQSELGQVSQVNSELQARLQQIDQISSDDMDRLLTYMPEMIDPLSVIRDLEAITVESGARLVDISDNGPFEETTATREARRERDAAGEGDGPYPYVFVLTAEGTYNQVKELISLMEQNEYPLEIQSLLLSVNEGGFIEATMGVHTYSQYPTEMPDVRLYQDINVIND